MFTTQLPTLDEERGSLILLGVNDELFEGFKSELRVMLLPLEKVILQALRDGVPVRCAIRMPFATPSANDNPTTGLTATSTMYSVTEISSAGALALATDDLSLKQHAPLTSISSVHIGDAVYYWSPRFNALSLQGEVGSTAFLTLVAPTLWRLSIPHVRVSAASQATLVACYPHLTKLVAYNLEAPEQLGALIQEGRLPCLRTLDLLRSRQSRGVIRQFAEFFQAKLFTTLRHLRVPVPGADEDQQGLLEVLKQNDSLVVIDVRAANALRIRHFIDQITSQLNETKPLPLRARMAFLSLARVWKSMRGMDPLVLGRILAFASKRVETRVNWIHDNN